MYGSIEQLEADFGVRVTDFRIPFIIRGASGDDPTGKSTMRHSGIRLLVESGAMPLVHYQPQREPGVVREVISGRLHRGIHRSDARLVLAARAGDRSLLTAAFRSLCVAHGIVLGDDGLKDTKRSRCAATDIVEKCLTKYSSDAMRWFLIQQWCEAAT